MTLFQARGVEPVAISKVTISIAFFVLSIGMLIRFLKNLRS
jgi:hypothetical protein